MSPEDQGWIWELVRTIERERMLEQKVDEIRDDVDSLKAMVQRGLLLAILWGGAVLLMLSNDKAADIIIAVLKRGG